MVSAVERTADQLVAPQRKQEATTANQKAATSRPEGSCRRVDGAETSRRHVKLAGNSFHGENSVRRAETNGGGIADDQTSIFINPHQVSEEVNFLLTPPVSHQPWCRCV